MNFALLDRLCAMYGISASYRDVWGEQRIVSVETRLALLAAMGIRVGSDAEVARAIEDREAQGWRRLLPAVRVVRAGGRELALTVTLPEACTGSPVEWTLEEENGGRRRGTFVPRELAVEARHHVAGTSFVRFAFRLPALPQPGYHRFHLHPPAQVSGPNAAMTLIVAPPRCYLPAAVERGRVWGPAVNLYALRSNRNWGIGDFTDLQHLVELAARTGAAVVGLNPLHALFPQNSRHASPYGPASRLLLNVFYIDPERVPEFTDCEKARDTVASPSFQAELHALRAADLIDYSRVARLKLPILEMLYEHFRRSDLHSGTDRAHAFRAYRRGGGETLRLASLFYALQETLRSTGTTASGWQSWPAPYRDPGSAAAAEFAHDHAERLEYYDYLQWNAEQQLDAVGKRASELHLGVGLYQDVAVGADPGGIETWAEQELYATDATVGSPPDDFNLNGQNWGILPLLPDRLTEAAYAPFIAMLRANMRHAGALRIDHVMALMRLYWIPRGARPDRGGYVSYPIEDLLGVLALESERNRCMVVGEDLGTLPSGLAEQLRAAGVLSYRLLYFERESDGAFASPSKYPVQAVASVGTHDLPTLRGYWLGHDLDVRARLDLFSGDDVRERQVVQRAQDRARLLAALERERLLPPGVSVHPVSAPEMTPELALAAHRFLARTRCMLLTVQPENIFGDLEQVNLPATTDADYPNWRKRLSLALEHWEADSRFAALASVLATDRGAAAAPAEVRRSIHISIPDATYRLQFNRSFTFAHATRLVPYLHDLGISHCYASPYFSARPGSMHGYDIVDHNAFNPEIGTAEEFESFACALRSRGMGQILDMVPNHMGVMGADNAWWLDVLENGPASAYASFFDIDWQAPQPELHGKLLIPVLGDHYGAVLERGELRLEFDRAAGAFSVFYALHRFPVDPAEYPYILGFRLEQLAQRIGTDNSQFAEYQTLMASFGHLPPRDSVESAAVLERQRDQEVHKRRMALLCDRNPNIALHIEESVRVMNGEAGRPESFDALDALLARQAYRLAYWRVASAEINYRRFFDTNDLAALRMEDDRVFEATHRLMFRLLDEGRVHGIRVDHPDGLYDPVRYFWRLQERYLPGVPGQQGSPLTGADHKLVYVVIEKILADHERLPEHWPLYGTTGYRFANVVNGLFVDTANERDFDRMYRAFTRERLSYEDVLRDSNVVIMRSALASELLVLRNRLSRIARADRLTRDFTLSALREALVAVVACFPVYRTYVAQEVSADDRRNIEWAVGAARRHTPAMESSVFEFLQRVLTGDAANGCPEARRQDLFGFVMRFQQFTASVTAKGMEDTAFYRYNRLVSLNEVGGNPRCFGMSLQAFHAASLDRARHWPHTMLATSTHDNKRSEDVRTRIDAISEFPVEWWTRLQRWRRMNRRLKRQVDGVAAPAANDEYLIYQTLLGTWPSASRDADALADYRARIENYMLKAVREAKVHTSWMNANEDYESALRQFLAGLLDGAPRNPFLADFAPFSELIARVGMFNSLSQTVIKIASPGVPDFYQGSELWNLNLVDPDNRRAVDFRQRLALLEELKAQFACAPEQCAGRAAALLERMENGIIKLFVTWRGLALRRQHISLFADGEYLPLETSGEHAGRICAFARVAGERAVIAVAPRLIGRFTADGRTPLGAVWGDTRLLLPAQLAGAYCNAYTCENLQSDLACELRIDAILCVFPVALLSRAADNGDVDAKSVH